LLIHFQVTIDNVGVPFLEVLIVLGLTSKVTQLSGGTLNVY